ncbi:MAG: hypothetical protein L0219_02135 [Phycisphaerales bacterium]|nr:hypothetical protein [Phycisphaerales bacterium]
MTISPWPPHKRSIPGFARIGRFSCASCRIWVVMFMDSITFHLVSADAAPAGISEREQATSTGGGLDWRVGGR